MHLSTNVITVREDVEGQEYGPHRPGGSNLHVVWPALSQNVEQMCA